MKKQFASALAATSILLAPALSLAATYEIDPAHSTAQFTVRHMMVTNVRGVFGKIAGTLKLDDKDVTKSTVEATIDASTIDTGNEKRDGHLKSPDFFDVEKNPNLIFKSTKVEKAGKGKLKVTGDLTMRGVTKPAVLDVTWPENEVKVPAEMGGGVKRGATATTKINRKDFGISWNSKMDGGGVVVGDEVAISIELELDKKDAAPAATDSKGTK